MRDLMEAWPCCSLFSVRIDDLPERERSYFSTFMPQATTAIVLGHHIITEEEWTWYATGDGGEHCAADDHCSEICNAIRAELTRQGHEAGVVDYPRESGLQFRFVAQAAGLGEIGTNAFLFHPDWGPWIHLRVMATTAPLALSARVAGEQLCDRCGLCVSECPAGAIFDENFEGLQCRSFRKAIGEYEP